MATGLPPPPLRNDSGDFSWLDWFNKLYKYLNTAGTIAWSSLDFSGSRLSDIQTRPHADLSSFQGGSAGERYHMTQAQHDGLVNGSSTTLHTHAHNNMGSIQGGAANDYYHLTNAQTTGLIGGGATTLHKHAHNNMDSLQGGTTNEYYHLSQADYNKVHTQPWVEAATTSGTITLSTTPTILKPTTTVSGSGITYDSSTGEFTFLYAGSYALSLHVNATASASNQFVYIFAETDNGSGFTVNANSGKLYELTNANTVQVVYAQAVHRTVGQKVRYKIYSNDVKVSLSTSALPGGVGASVPAIRIQYAG